jgi:hypothetical protein
MWAYALISRAQWQSTPNASTNIYQRIYTIYSRTQPPDVNFFFFFFFFFAVQFSFMHKFFFFFFFFFFFAGMLFTDTEKSYFFKIKELLFQDHDSLSSFEMPPTALDSSLSVSLSSESSLPESLDLRLSTGVVPVMPNMFHAELMTPPASLSSARSA